MSIKDVLQLNDGIEELEVSFDPSTLETKIGKMTLSKDDLIALTAFWDNAITAKSIQESKENSVVSKILKKIGGEDSLFRKGMSVNWI